MVSSSYRWTDRSQPQRRVGILAKKARCLGVSGGSASTALDPGLQNTYTRQATTYLERELAANFGIRTGFVWNGRRQVRATVNANRPFDALQRPGHRFVDPGPDGRAGTADDGATFTAYNLAAAER